jgi:hypothetical protein
MFIVPTLRFHSARNQSGKCTPLLATVHLYCILQLSINPHVHFNSTRNQRGNCIPILTTVRFYRILQLDVFVLSPFTRTSSRPVDAGIQNMMPSSPTPTSRSTQCQIGRFTMRLYRILQLDVFVLLRDE